MIDELPEAKIIKHPLVLWSGGFDSTCLVIEKLQEGDIDVMYVRLENNERMQRREKKAIGKLKILIKDANLKGSVINEFSFGYEYIDITKGMFALPGLWLQAAVYLVNPQVHSEINIGYVKGDDAWHYKSQIQKVYKSLLALVCDSQDVVPLKFPYEWYTKADILAGMESFMYNKQMMNLIYYCENGAKSPCGSCGSCKRHSSELGIVKEPRVVAVDMTDEYSMVTVDSRETEHDK
jgi:7-cyano-7-deazaguanine synthase in queuosine biosynthesis